LMLVWCQVWESYLPAQMSVAEIEALVDAAIVEAKATTAKQMVWQLSNPGLKDLGQ
jgi:uncharacterized protein YqeY